MKNNKFIHVVSGVFVLLVLNLVGCTHPMDITNISRYYNTTHVSLDNRVKIGIKSDNYSMEGRRLTKMLADSLGKYNTCVTTLGSGPVDSVDVIATMSVRSNYKGSGWNFLVNFPGFLIFAPAWHGYNYEVSHMIDVSLQDAKSGKSLGNVNLPVVLDIRHADMNRTWTECSWFEVGAVALVGGVVFVQYDETITPQVTQKAGPIVADYVAQEMVDNLRSFRTSAPVAIATPKADDVSTGDAAQKLTALKSLWEQKLLTDDEYATKRGQLIDAM